MKNVSVVLHTEFKVGRQVIHKTDPEKNFIVTNYCIQEVDDAGLVTCYTIGVSSGDGQFTYYKPIELELVETYEDERKS